MTVISAGKVSAFRLFRFGSVISIWELAMVMVKMSGSTLSLTTAVSMLSSV